MRNRCCSQIHHDAHVGYPLLIAPQQILHTKQNNITADTISYTSQGKTTLHSVLKNTQQALNLVI